MKTLAHPHSANALTTQPGHTAAAALPGAGADCLLLATSWYPEQWPRAQWANDLKLMQEAGIGLVRVAEFAWSVLEPVDGEFCLEWLEDAIALAGSMGFRVIVGTPTAAPPLWLTQKHPEIIRQSHDEIPSGVMGRCHFRHASKVYHTYAARIARVMAERFGPNPHVVGWQIDNEYTSFSHDQETGAAFRDWLRNEYGTLDNLNQRWGCAYWSRTITDWDQIPVNFRGGVSPVLLAAFRRFVTHTVRAYQAVQAAEIRPRMGPGQFLSHNFHVPFAMGDNTIIASDLDLALFDYYPEERHDSAKSGWWFALARGLKRQNFWLIETQVGTVKYKPVNPALPRGVTRALCWHAIGLGADLVGFWQWRPCLGGGEQYWGTIVGPSGAPRPIYQEIARIGADFAHYRDALTGTNPVYDVALFFSDEDRWIIDHERFHKSFGAHEHLSFWHAGLSQQGLGVEVMDPAWSLAGHRLAIATALPVLTPARETALLDWVQKGGHLVIGPRSFHKNRDGAWLAEARPPGAAFAAASGTEVAEYFALEEPVSITAPWGASEASIWAEILETVNPGEVVARYGPEHSWLDGQVAITTRTSGAGRITLLGFWPSPQAFPGVVRWLTELTGIATHPLPPGVAVHRRQGEGREVIIAINHGETPQTVSLPAPSAETLTLASQAVEVRVNTLGGSQ